MKNMSLELMPFEELRTFAEHSPCPHTRSTYAEVGRQAKNTEFAQNKGSHSWRLNVFALSNGRLRVQQGNALIQPSQLALQTGVRHISVKRLHK